MKEKTIWKEERNRTGRGGGGRVKEQKRRTGEDIGERGTNSAIEIGKREREMGAGERSTTVYCTVYRGSHAPRSSSGVDPGY